MSHDASSLATRESSEEPSIYGRARQINQDAHTLVADLQEAADTMQHYVLDEMKRNPYATLAVAAGIGYLLGGGLSSRVTKLMIGVATRLAMAVAARELGNRVDAAHVARTTS